MATGTGEKEFSVVDYAVFAASLCVSLGIGIYHAIRSRHEKGSNLLVARSGKPMSVLPVAASVVASYLSAITILGTPSEMYGFGTEWWFAILGIPIAAVIASYTFVPIIYRLELTSIYEYLEKRYDTNAVRLVGTSLFLMLETLSLGVATYGPALAISSVTGLSTAWAIFLSFIVCTIYTGIGGLKAVVWTDAFQSLVMMAGLLSIIVKGSIDVGGLDNVWSIAKAGERIKFGTLSPDPFLRHNFWALVSNFTLIWLFTFGCRQATVQRFCSLPSLSDARKVIFLSVPGVMILTTSACLCGIVIYANYAGCDPVAAGYIDNRDKLTTHYVLDHLGHLRGLPGLFVAALFSGALSSMSSSINSLAAVTWEDFIKRTNWGRTLSERGASNVIKVMGFAYGLLGVGVAFVASTLEGVLQVTYTVIGTMSGPLLGMFLLSVFVPFVSVPGVITGILTGTAMSTWIGFGAWVADLPGPEALPTSVLLCNPPVVPTAAPDLDETSQGDGLEKIYSISYLLTIHIGTLVTIFVAVLVSFIPGLNTVPNYDLELVFPPIARVYQRYWAKKLDKKYPGSKEPNAITTIPVAEYFQRRKRKLPRVALRKPQRLY